MSTEGIAREAFRRNVIQAIEDEAIEDGYTHPSEQIMGCALEQTKVQAADWIQSMYADAMVSHPSTAAGILRCVGRLPRELIEPWGFALAASGFAASSVEIREAAVGMCESWGGQKAFDALTQHRHAETVAWLKRYIEAVIVDLS